MCTAAGAEDLPFPDASFDLAVSSFAFHHIAADRRAAAVREAFRVLRPGGRLLIAEVRLPSIPLAHRLAPGGMRHAMAHNVSDEARELVVDAGFMVTDTGDLPLVRYIAADKPQ